MTRGELREAARRAAEQAPPMSAEVRERLTALLRRRPADRWAHRAAGSSKARATRTAAGETG